MSRASPARLEKASSDGQVLEVDTDFVAPVRNVASLMMDRACKVAELRVTTKFSDSYDRVYHPTVQLDRPVRPIKPGYSHPWLPGIDLATVANSVVASREIDPIPLILVSTFEREIGRFLETALLELAACVEGLDRRLRKDGDQSYRRRLARPLELRVLRAQSQELCAGHLHRAHADAVTVRRRPPRAGVGVGGSNGGTNPPTASAGSRCVRGSIRGTGRFGALPEGGYVAAAALFAA
jgi:hypothetical protein